MLYNDNKNSMVIRWQIISHWIFGDKTVTNFHVDTKGWLFGDHQICDSFLRQNGGKFVTEFFSVKILVIESPFPLVILGQAQPEINYIYTTLEEI